MSVVCLDWILGNSHKLNKNPKCSLESQMYIYLGSCCLGGSTVQFSSVAQSCPTLCDPTNHSTPGLLVHHQLPEFTQTHVHWVGDDIQPSHPLSSPSPPAFNLSQHPGLFKWVSSLHQVAKVLEFSFSISPFNEHPGLISFRMDLLDLLAVQGTLKRLLQHHSSKHQLEVAQHTDKTSHSSVGMGLSSAIGVGTARIQNGKLKLGKSTTYY